LVDKDLVTFCFQKHNKDVHICEFGKTVSESFDKNTLTKLYIDTYAYTGAAETVKHFKILLMRFSAKVSLCTGV